jgi:hypothetical protein
MLKPWLTSATMAVAMAVGANDLLAQVSDDDALPDEGLAAYSDYRSALLAAGWQPVAQENSRPGLEEVVCGNRTCSAAWRSRSGRDVTLVLWPTFPNADDSEVLRLAPQYEDGL